jgi:hypothetical protein
VDIPTLLKQSGSDRIGILKLDIEGTERFVSSQGADKWIDRVDIMVIELHDRIFPGCTAGLYAAIDKNQWTEFRGVEKVMLVRKSVS